MRSRIVLAAALATGALVASSAQAAKTPQIIDPKGDALTGQASHDIVSVKFDAPRTGKSKTSPVKTFDVTLELAGPASIDPGVSYQIFGEIAGCGKFYLFSYFSVDAAGPDTSMQVGCGSPPDARGSTTTFVDVTTKTEGNKIIWSAAGRAVPKEVKLNTAFTGLYAYTALTEPVVGYTTEDNNPTPDGTSAIDATKTITYKYGS